MKVELYILGDRVELFDDETITIKTIIQNVRDIAKIFTDFTKTFNIPASGQNNKVFQHYYNSGVNGFDGRIKHEAEIKLNGVSFRKGYIKLINVTLKNNKASAYNVTFFGNTIQLADLLGSDKIQDLPLSLYDHTFDEINVKAGLTSSVTAGTYGTITAGDIIYPLLTHSERYFMQAAGATLTGLTNIQYNNATLATGYGVTYTDLKPAIKVLRIIESITDKYPALEFSSDFFTSSNTAINDLYMWLHRNKGQVNNFNNEIYSSALASGLTLTSGVDVVDSWDSLFSMWEVRSYSNTAGTTAVSYSAAFKVTPIGTQNYNVTITNSLTGEVIREDFNVSGTNTFVFSLKPPTGFTKDYSVTSRVSSYDGLVSYVGEYTIIKTETSLGSPSSTTGVYTTPTINVSSTVDVAGNTPDMLVIDFLTGLFKIFNLTAYEENGLIYIKTLDEFYDSGEDRDITKFIDITSNTAGVAPLYNLIQFKYMDPETFLADAYRDLTNNVYGNLKYAPNYDGDEYVIQTPFEHMMFEKLLDINDDSATDICYGYFVDENQEPLIAAPLLFYNKSTTAIKNIGFNNIAGVSSLGTYNRPANNIANNSLHFGSEIDEFTSLEVASADSLFNKYYTTYITSVFNIRQRLSKFKAYLPLSFLLNYTLADTVIINTKKYKINSITVNLTTKECELILLNYV